MKQYKKIGLALILFMLALRFFHYPFFVPPHQPGKTYTVTAKEIKKSLSYSGIIEPIKSNCIISAVEGSISEMYFHYGDQVKRGQLLFSLSSEKFQIAYKT